MNARAVEDSPCGSSAATPAPRQAFLPASRKHKSTGRRDLRLLPLEEERIELVDELFERLVAEKKAEGIGFKESCKIAWKRGGARRLVVARVKYRAVDARGEPAIETTPMPPELFPRPHWRNSGPAGQKSSSAILGCPG